MNLRKKKALAARTLGVGKGRIKFAEGRLEEIKEAITSQDMISLAKKGAIEIRAIKGRMKKEKRRTKRGFGKTKKKVKKEKQDYVRRTRKLRAYLNNLKMKGEISIAEYKNLRNEIKSSKFKSKEHLKEQINEAKRMEK
ncbi:hypothetical protein J4447_01825 [Candidatus Pacearchaeota archaeon]|nr:hypothetical protein [Candidatus Pacearchaeota archaeon]